jgi:hypothetical protein
MSLWGQSEFGEWLGSFDKELDLNYCGSMLGIEEVEMPKDCTYMDILGCNPGISLMKTAFRRTEKSTQREDRPRVLFYRSFLV